VDLIEISSSAQDATVIIYFYKIKQSYINNLHYIAGYHDIPSKVHSSYDLLYSRTPQERESEKKCCIEEKILKKTLEVIERFVKPFGKSDN